MEVESKIDYILSKAESELLILKGDPNKRHEAELKERTIRDINSALAYSKKHGFEQEFRQKFEEGFEQGVKQGKIENARNLLNILDDETIANCIGLDVKTVRKLRDETV